MWRNVSSKNANGWVPRFSWHEKLGPQGKATEFRSPKQEMGANFQSEIHWKNFRLDSWHNFIWFQKVKGSFLYWIYSINIIQRAPINAWYFGTPKNNFPTIMHTRFVSHQHRLDDTQTLV